MEFEYFLSHPSLNDPYYCRAYTFYRRTLHSPFYLLCLYQIEDGRL